MRILVRVVAWIVLVPGLVWAVVRVFGLEGGRAVQLIAFTPYAAMGSVLLAGLIVALRQWKAGIAAAVIAVALVACVVPRAIPSRDKGPGKGVALHVMTANLRLGSADPATIVGLVRSGGVEVLAVQEFTPQARDAFSAAGLDTLLPYHELSPMAGAYGSGLYAKYPITDAGYRNDGFRQAYGVIQPPGAEPVLVESAHPYAPSDATMVGYWQRTLAKEPQAGGNPPRILIGDFNSTLDSAGLRKLISEGYRDAADTLGDGLIGTWGPYYDRKLPPITLDHVLADKRIGVNSLDVDRLPNSDHRAVRATLIVPEAAQ